MIYHLKPVGTKKYPVREDETFDIDEIFDFKTNPKKIYKGDRLIVFGVGSSRIISIYEVVDEVACYSKDKEYPFSLRCKNLTPDYSKNWFVNNLRWTDLECEFKRSFRKTVRTSSNTLRGIQFGLTSLSVSIEFGRFVENKVKHPIIGMLNKY